MPSMRDPMELPPKPSARPAQPDGSLLKFLAEHGTGTPLDYGDARRQTGATLLAGAARRRKLGVSRVHRSHHIIIGGGRVVGGFAGQLTSLASDEADRAALSLPTARALLHRATLPVPEGRAFSPDAVDDGLSWFSALDGSVVVKPASSRAGKGITRNVRGADDFTEAWHSAVAERADVVDSDPSVVIERQHPGFDLRVFVVGEEVVAALARVPLFCIGDGHSTVRELVTDVAKRRDAHPLYKTASYDPVDYAQRNGVPLDTMSEIGQPHLLGDDVAVPSGGVAVDVTTLLAEELKTLAVDAVWAVPGCKAAGVDLLVDDVAAAEDAVVLDVDARARFVLHHYPWMGRRRTVATSIVKQMGLGSTG